MEKRDLFFIDVNLHKVRKYPLSPKTIRNHCEIAHNFATLCPFLLFVDVINEWRLNVVKFNNLIFQIFNWNLSDFTKIVNNN